MLETFHSRLDAVRIARARGVIDPIFCNTPQYISDALTDELGVRVMVKVETANPIRCFKGRGADLFMSSLERGDAVVTASAGNLGQAMAYSARKRQIDLTVYAAVNANPLKVERMIALGADVKLEGHDFDAAKKAAREKAKLGGVTMVEDGVEPLLSEGAGTIALEILEAEDVPDAVLVSLGNGAILGGMARAIKAINPTIKVIGVAAQGAPCMERSWRTRRIVTTTAIDTIADGMGTRVLVPEALADIRADVDDIILVSDESMIAGLKIAHRCLGLVLEPSGAAGLAAIMQNVDRFKGQLVATVLCGGNVTNQQFMEWLA